MRTPVLPPALDNHLGGVEAPRYRAFEFELIEPHLGRSVMEVGSGLGEFAEKLEGLDRLVLTDSDPYCLDQLRARFSNHPEVEVRSLDLASADDVTPEPPVDTVVAINVLEHIEDDVGALKRLAQSIVPGGNLVIWVPGFPALYGDFDRKVGHVRRYTPETLSAALRAAGLIVDEAPRPVNLLGGLAWWLAVRLGRAGAPKPGLIKIYDRLVIPATRRIELLMRVPFGQTVLAVGRTHL